MTPKTTSPDDPQDMRGQVLAWPNLLEQGYREPLPDLSELTGRRQIVCCGMGGSAIGVGIIGDLIDFRIPYSVVRDYTLPASVDEHSLVICASHSGGTEETLACFDEAKARGAAILAITTGGELAKRAEAADVPCILFEHDSQPRAALPLTLGLLLNVFAALSPDEGVSFAAEVEHAVETLRQMVSEDPDPELVKAMTGRIPFVYGAGLTAEAARRMKGQISENANQTAGFEVLPEQNHNGLVGLEFPAPLGDRFCGIFLRTSDEHPQVAKRFELTTRLFTERQIPAVTIRGRGTGRLAELCSILFAGDLASVDLAYRNGVDPTPVDVITDFKAELEQS
jgi:glucose/mannose-6-phosphate isomerase